MACESLLVDYDRELLLKSAGVTADVYKQTFAVVKAALGVT